jgi:SAM-dependent methyltransferase
VEFGCGNGRDSVFFARAGHTVFGCDMSRAGIATAQKGAIAAGAGDCRFFPLDISQPDEIDAFFARPELAEAIRAERQLLIYMRFFLHAITEQAERTLFTALRRNIPREYRIAAEFRTDQDCNTEKAHTVEHFRRYIRPNDLIARMTSEYGLVVNSTESGYGLSVYRTEDPHLCRVLATAPSRSADAVGIVAIK